MGGAARAAPTADPAASLVRQRVEAAHSAGTAPLVDGYAPFCKHVFLSNWTPAPPGAALITPQNARLLKCGYSARRPEELAVLTRWFDAADLGDRPAAAFLDVILYSRAQIADEREALPAADRGAPLPAAPWGIISVKAQDEGQETPMQPITMMRNALGRDEGGSGVRLDAGAYRAAVDYWRDRAPVSAGGGAGE